MIIACACVLAAVCAAEPEPGKAVPGSPGTDGSSGDHRVPTKPVEPVAPEAVSPPGLPVVAVAPPFPHPIITEVLFAVPPGASGDANRDGTRDAAGDEFVELINPHDRAIQLFGYTLMDSQEPGKGQLKFTFPALELAPGEVVVVFNGFGATIAEPVGDQRTPPSGPNAAFHGARVFSMRCPSNKTAFGNAGDHVMLTAPDGTLVQRVWWSEDPAGRAVAPANKAAGGGDAPATTAKPAPKLPLIDDYAPIAARSGVMRDTLLATGRFASHMELERTAFSPGAYVVVKPPAPPSSQTPPPRPAESPAP